MSTYDDDTFLCNLSTYRMGFPSNGPQQELEFGLDELEFGLDELEFGLDELLLRRHSLTFHLDL